jgi:hypothetical protein
MNRRIFLRGSTTALLLSQTACLNNPITNPNPTSNGTQSASVSTSQLNQVIMTQQCEQWCWAACISMMFGFYGHPITQAEIVLATYGNVVCLPSGTTIGSDINRAYIDDRGVLFQSQITAAYDFVFGVNLFDNLTVVNQLQTNNPLLYCNTHHAMIVYAVDYIPTPGEPNIVAVHVVDPWPFSPRTHTLTPPEMVPAHLGGQMMFLASIRVT